MTVTNCSILMMGMDETIICIHLCISQFFSKHFQISWKRLMEVYLVAETHRWLDCLE